MSNLEYLITRPGIFKMATVALGAAAFTLTSFSFAESPYSEFYSNWTEVDDGQSDINLPGTELELYLMSATGIFLVVSLVYLVLYCIYYKLCESSWNRIVDTGYHLVAALFLFAGGGVNFYSAIDIERNGCEVFFDLNQLTPTPHGRFFSPPGIQNQEKVVCHYFKAKIIAAAFSSFNAVIYGITAIIVITTKDL